MKKILLIILVLALFLLGCGEESQITGGAITAPVCNSPYILVGTSCCLDQNNNKICDKDETEETSEETVLEPTNPIFMKDDSVVEPVLPENQYELTKGESFSVEDSVFVLIDYDFDYMGSDVSAIISVDGAERELFSTRNRQIVNDWEIMIISINKFEKSLILQIKPFKLNPNEYFLTLYNSAVVDGKTVKLRDVLFSDDAILVDIVGTENTKNRVAEGRSVVIEGLKITNIDAFPRNSRLERAAIVKIVPA